MDQSTPGPPVFHCLPELGQINIDSSVTLFNHLILCHPLLLLPSHFPNIRVFSRESSLLIRWPKHWSLSFRICSSSEHSGLISFRIDRFVLLAVQRTLKSLLHHNSKASILWQSAFFMVQLSLTYIATLFMLYNISCAGVLGGWHQFWGCHSIIYLPPPLKKGANFSAFPVFLEILASDRENHLITRNYFMSLLGDQADTPLFYPRTSLDMVVTMWIKNQGRWFPCLIFKKSCLIKNYM